MCGIAGAIDATAGRAAAIVSMINQLQEHRGPDHSVVTRVGVFTLGNTRLAVQDPTPAGNQPFVSADRRYYCVFNGEIYNHRLLAQRYQLPVRTRCDGEVLLELWAKLGSASLAELRGMFAIALVDTLEERLYLARDPFGIKPIYWRELSDARIVFASEVHPLVRATGEARIDGQAIGHYLRFGAMAADQAPFREVKAVPPNTVAVFDRDSQVALHPILPDGPIQLTSAPQDLAAALTSSVDLHLGADVPTALLLSAGVDSAAIAAVGKRLGRSLHCLTMGTGGAADESAEAAETARHYGHDVQQVSAVLESDDVAKFFRAMQRPTVDGLNTYIVSKAVHEAGFKVALSGLGGDEALGGYSHFRLLKYLPALRAMNVMPDLLTGAVGRGLVQLGITSSKAARLLTKGGPRDGKGLCLLQREVLPAPLVADLTGVSDKSLSNLSLQDPVISDGSFGAMVAAEVAIYLQSTLLPDADSFSMTSSVELRVPYVDSHFFWAAQASALGKRTPPGKVALGIALGDPYLKELASRPKRGFSVPMRHWMDGPLLPVLRAAQDPHAAVWSILDRNLAERAGLLPFGARARWVETWVVAALNSWLETDRSRTVCS